MEAVKADPSVKGQPAPAKAKAPGVEGAPQPGKNEKQTTIPGMGDPAATGKVVDFTAAPGWGNERQARQEKGYGEVIDLGTICPEVFFVPFSKVLRIYFLSPPITRHGRALSVKGASHRRFAAACP